MRLVSRIAFLSAVFAILLTPLGCVRSRGIPSNADGILGHVEKYFYSTKSATEAEVVVTNDAGKPAKIITLVNKQVVSTVEVDTSKVSFSSDGKVVLVEGSSAIFENSPITVAEVVSGPAAPPPAKVDTHCINVSPTEHDEIDVIIDSETGRYSLTEVTGGVRSTLGGSGLTGRTNTSQYVNYSKSVFGTLRVDFTAPAEEPFFHRASFVGTAAPYSQVDGMVCRLNTVPVVEVPTHTVFYIGGMSLDGDLGGLMGADALCRQAAVTGSKTSAINTGLWRAVLSTSTSSASSRINLTNGAKVKNSMGETIVDNAATFLTATTLLKAIRYNQNGTVSVSSSGVFTGDSAANCGDWTSTSSPSTGRTGAPIRTDAFWWSIPGSAQRCDAALSIYCINSNN